MNLLIFETRFFLDLGALIFSIAWICHIKLSREFDFFDGTEENIPTLIYYWFVISQFFPDCLMNFLVDILKFCSQVYPSSTEICISFSEFSYYIYNSVRIIGAFIVLVELCRMLNHYTLYRSSFRFNSSDLSRTPLPQVNNPERAGGVEPFTGKGHRINFNKQKTS